MASDKVVTCYVPPSPGAGLHSAMQTIELLHNGLKEMALVCSEEQAWAFMTYLSELKKWNRAYNLTALKKDEDIVVKHFLDSLLYLKALPPGTLALADAGAGAGFPGIPLKIMRPGIDVALIESSGKKTAFLRHIARVLKLGRTDIIEKRLERLGKAYEKRFDVMVSRATFTVSDFLKRACPYVKDSGRLILNKGPRLSEEIKELELCRHGKVPPYDVMTVRLPVADTERKLIVLSCKMKP